MKYWTHDKGWRDSPVVSDKGLGAVPRTTWWLTSICSRGHVLFFWTPWAHTYTHAYRKTLIYISLRNFKHRVKRKTRSVSIYQGHSFIIVFYACKDMNKVVYLCVVYVRMWYIHTCVCMCPCLCVENREGCWVFHTLPYLLRQSLTEPGTHRFSS